MKIYGSIITLVLCTSSVYGMDLAEIQGMALENRSVIRQYITKLEQSNKSISLARAGYYPFIDVSYTINTIDEATPVEHEENSVAAGRISWNIFSGFRDKYNLQSAKILQEIEEHRLQWIKQSVQLDVALAYLKVYERLANRRVAEASFSTLKRVYKDAESRYQVEQISKNELLKFRVDYDNANIALKIADADLEKSVNSLCRQAGRKIKFAELNFTNFLDLPSLMDREDYTNKMLAGNSEIKVLRLAIEATAARVSADLGGYYPKIDLVGSYRRYDDDFVNGNGLVRADELRAQLIVSMNLFQGFSTETTAAKTRLDKRAIQYELEELQNGLISKLHNLHIDFRVSLKSVEVANRSVEQAKENLRIAQLKYDKEFKLESDLLDAITNLSRAQYNRVAILETVFSNNFQLTRMIDGF